MKQVNKEALNLKHLVIDSRRSIPENPAIIQEHLRLS
jgi:hypothetical protein